MKLGAMEITPVLDGWTRGSLPANKPLPEFGTPARDAQHGMFGSDGRIESTFGGFLVRTGDRLVLVDAGGGPALAGGFRAPVIDPTDPDDPIAGALRQRGYNDEQVARAAGTFGRVELDHGALPASLAAVGVAPEDVTDVVLTHLHFDHIGWVSADGAPYFPNATIRCAAADLDHFLPGADDDVMVSLVYRALPVAERLGPVLDRIETWDADETLLPGVDVRLAPGHTPGSSVVVLSEGTERAMLLGDIVHCPLELMDDEFELFVDMDQAAANRVREAYARELEGADIAVAAAHFPGLQFGRLLPGEGVRRWTFDAA